jgi:hypothetical protein
MRKALASAAAFVTLMYGGLTLDEYASCPPQPEFRSVAKLRDASLLVKNTIAHLTNSDFGAVLRHPEQVHITTAGMELVMSPFELMFNVYRTIPEGSEGSPWKDLHWKDYDEIPSLDLRRNIFKRQLQQYGSVLRSQAWVQMTLDDWRAVPAPIRVTAYLKMIQQEAKSRPSRYITSDTLARIMVDVAKQESFFMIHNFLSSSKGNSDIGLFQISDGTRNALRRLREFRGLDDEDFYNPLVSVKAGAEVLERNIAHSKGDLEKAVMMYNVGVTNAEKRTLRAQAYLQSIYERDRKAFQDTARYSDTLLWMLLTAGYHLPVQDAPRPTAMAAIAKAQPLL